MKSENIPGFKSKKRLKIIILISLIDVILLISIGCLVVNQMIYYYTDPWNSKVAEAGFVEKTTPIAL